MKIQDASDNIQYLLQYNYLCNYVQDPLRYSSGELPVADAGCLCPVRSDQGSECVGAREETECGGSHHLHCTVHVQRRHTRNDTPHGTQKCENIC